MLQRNKGLQTLDMTGCITIGDTGVEEIIKCVVQNASLKLLHLPAKFQAADCATEYYSKIQGRIKWTSDISTQEEVEFIEDKYVDATILGKQSK